MSNPFESPGAPPPHEPPPPPPARTPGDFDVKLAFSDGLDAVKRNVWPWVGGSFVAFCVLVVSALFCLAPLVVTGPLLAIGWTRFSLQAVDGRAEIRQIVAPFDDVGRWLLPALALIALLFLIDLPGIAASQGIGWALGTLVPSDVPNPEDFGQVMAVVGQQVVVGQVAGLAALAWQALVTVRFLPSLFLLAERGTNPMDALSQSWTLTRRTGVKLAVVVLLLYFVGIAALLVGVLLCFVGVLPLAIFANALTTAVRASIYRQLTGTRRAVA